MCERERKEGVYIGGMIKRHTQRKREKEEIDNRYKINMEIKIDMNLTYKTPLFLSL